MKRLMFLTAFALLAPPTAFAEVPDCGSPFGENVQVFINPVMGDMPEQVSFTTPNTFFACPQFGCCSTISTEGVPEDWTIRGQVLVQYNLGNACDSNGDPLPSPIPGLLPPNRIIIETINYDQMGDLSLQVCLPSIHDWLSHETHVDIFLEVLDENGLRVPWIGVNGVLGTGSDWDAFCQGNGSLGCTPGFWKNHLPPSFTWPDGLNPTDDFNTIFGCGPSITLLEALNLSGNRNCESLVRHAAAGLLNAAFMDGDAFWPCGDQYTYQFTVDEVKALFCGAYLTPACNSVRDSLETANTTMCAPAAPPVWLNTQGFQFCGTACNPFWVPPF